MIKRAVACIALLFLAAVVCRDSLFHFNTASIEVKREHNSAQRNWNIGYSPRYVYYDSPFRYRNDLLRIAEIIEPGYTLLSDLATSYYASAMLPVYVLNVHTHHMSKRSKMLAKVLSRREFCYLEDRFHRRAAVQYLKRDTRLAGKNNWPEIRYMLLNKDKENSNLHDDCLALRSRQLEVSIPEIGHLLYEGEYLNMYELDSFTGSSAED